jgi:choline dehydrogenase-like flavoprotein
MRTALRPVGNLVADNMGLTLRSTEIMRRRAEIAVVGSGPVGMKVALDLADSGLDVLLIESGVDGNDRAQQGLCDAIIEDSTTHAPMSLAVKRTFGGTSHLWGGRAVPFDALDFTTRSVAPHVSWPVTFTEVAQWYEAACRFLDCGPSCFEDVTPITDMPAADGLRFDRLERWCTQPNMTRVHGTRLKAHPRIRLALGATVLRINVDPERGTVSDLTVAAGSERLRVAARAYVIAAGGLETARLMLASRLETPGLFGSPDGPLGHCYMGHMFGSIADIVFERPGIDQAFDFARDASGRYCRRRFTLDERTQQQHGLLNMAAWPELPPLDDPRHGSGILSMAYLALATPVLGSLLSPDAIRQRKLGKGPIRVWPHAKNVVRDVVGSARFARQFLMARYASAVRIPGFLVRNGARRYALHYHGEQAPNLASRVRLSETRDALGQPRLTIGLRYSEGDASSVLRTHTLMEQELARIGVARIEYKIRQEERLNAVLAQASDGFHQIGTARMAADPRKGVVGTDARVHGVSNLFLAGSAIFPSSSHANPTLTAVALAARLAAHLTRTLPSMTA